MLKVKLMNYMVKLEARDPSLQDDVVDLLRDLLVTQCRHIRQCLEPPVRTRVHHLNAHIMQKPQISMFVMKRKHTNANKI